MRFYVKINKITLVLKDVEKVFQFQLCHVVILSLQVFFARPERGKIFKS